MADHFDLLIRGGTVVDGNGGEPFVGDVAIRDGQIAAMGDVSGEASEICRALKARGSFGFSKRL